MHHGVQMTAVGMQIGSRIQDLIQWIQCIQVEPNIGIQHYRTFQQVTPSIGQHNRM